jgi:hypothetical protein
MPPITPAEIVAKRRADVPEKVFDAWNTVIAKNYVGTAKSGYSDFTITELMTELLASGYTREEISENRWVDLEDIYRKSGWSVRVDIPGYNESYDTRYEFKTKR